MEKVEIKYQRIPHDRIRSLTSDKVNQKIDLKTQRDVRGVKTLSPDAIKQRINELDKEWDIDRVLMLNFSIIVFAQLMAARKSKNLLWLWGPLIQTPFLFLHSTIGLCPPSLWFRAMGFRTKNEIHAERDFLSTSLEA